MRLAHHRRIVPPSWTFIPPQINLRRSNWRATLDRSVPVVFQLRREESAVRQGETLERPGLLGRQGVFQSEPPSPADHSRSAGERRGSLQVQSRFPKLADQESQGQLLSYR